MIISCNSCGKKFVVPDKAISESGRLVQCSACGNKWTQFPIGKKTKTTEKVSEIKPIKKKTINPSKKSNQQKIREPKLKRKPGRICILQNILLKNMVLN